MWRERINEKREELGLSYKCIAEKTETSEKTISRLFTGKTKCPPTDLLYSVAVVLGLSLDDLLADSNSVVGGKCLAELQEEANTLAAEVERLTAELALMSAENAVLKDKVVTLTGENDILRIKLEHKEELILHKDKIIALHDYCIKLKSNE